MPSRVSNPSAQAFIGPLLAFFAFVLAIIGSFRCDLVSVTFTALNRSYSLGFGIWYYQGWSYYSDEPGQVYFIKSCFSYGDDVSMDSYWKTAMAFSIISAVIGGLACIASCVSPCVEGCAGNKVFAITFMFPTTLFYGLNLLFVKSNACKNSLVLDLFPDLDGFASANCDIGWGGNCIIAATVLSFFAGAVMCCVSVTESKADEAEDNMGGEEPVEAQDDTDAAVAEEPMEKDIAVMEEPAEKDAAIALAEEPAEKDAAVAEEPTEMDAAVVKEPAEKDAAVAKE